MYLPKSKYVVIQSKPEEYIFDGKQYTGPVLVSYTGQCFAGDSIENLKGEVFPVRYDSVKTTSARKTVQIKRIPTEQEYLEGEMIRYFKQDLKTLKTIEILPEEYQKERNSEGIYEFYRFLEEKWYLLGKEAIGKNERTIIHADSKIPGIISSKVLWNPLEFVKV